MFQKFLDNLENFFVSLVELQAFRNSNIYNDFLKRWNVSIYFGLRYQAIIRVLEKSFENTFSFQGSPESNDKATFCFPQTTILWNQLKECWSPEIFIPALTDSFCKLSLQLISRYCSWIQHGIDIFNSVSF